MGEHLGCCKGVSDESDWSDKSDLPAGFSGGHYRLVCKYRWCKSVVLSGERLGCCKGVSDESDWSDWSDLPAGFSGGHYRFVCKYRRK